MGRDGSRESTLAVLGVLELRVAEVPVGLSLLQRQLVGTLALRPDRVMTVDRLAYSLWGEQPPRSAHNRVQALVSNVRRRIGCVGDVSGLIATVCGGYRLAADLVQLDTDRFAELHTLAKRLAADGHPAESCDRYRAALALWRGDPFDGLGLSDPDLPAVTTHLGELRWQAFEECVEMRLAAGDSAVLVPELVTAVERHPFREVLRMQQMVALVRCGRSSDALEVYRRGYAATVDELGLPPGEALQELHRAVLAGDNQLVDIGQPKPVGRTEGKRAPTVNPPRQLPAPPQRFTGRARELVAIDALPDTSTVVISAVDGMAGVGKTALAVHAAHQLADRYPDGQLFIDLHGYTCGVAPVEPPDALDHMLRAGNARNPDPGQCGSAGRAVPQQAGRPARVGRA